MDHRAVAERLYALMRASPAPANFNLDGPEPPPEVLEFRRRANEPPPPPEEGKTATLSYLERATAIKRAMIAEVLADAYGDP